MTLDFMYGKKMRFICPVKGKYTFIGGASSTGKTYFFNCLHETVDILNASSVRKDPPGQCLNDGRILFLNWRSNKEDIDFALRKGDMAGEHYIVCIDNGDRLFEAYPDLVGSLKAYDNQYIVAARSHWGFHIPIRDALIAKLIKEPDMTTLKFQSEVLM